VDFSISEDLKWSKISVPVRRRSGRSSWWTCQGQQYWDLTTFGAPGTGRTPPCTV